MRDEDFIISKDGSLLFRNLDVLIPLLMRKKPKCSCGETLIFDTEAFFKSKEKVFVSKYKCKKCLAVYSILDLEDYKIKKIKDKEC